MHKIWGKGAVLAAALLAVPAAQGNDYPPAIAHALSGGLKVVKRFPASSALTGWVLSRNGKYSIVYTTPDGETLIVGGLIDASGKNLSVGYAKQYIPGPDYQALFPQLEETRYIQEGELANPKATLYVFFDADCIFCHLAWKALQPYEKAGLRVRWVPVAVLKPTSVTRAVAIMTAEDPAAALNENETQFDKQAEEGGIIPVAKPDPALTGRLKANTELMRKFGGTGTPALVWQDAKGQVRFKTGMPMLSELPGITGLPAQAENDPDLARFR